MLLDFGAKVRIIRLYDLGNGEIAASNKDYVAKMGVVDRRTIGMADRFVHLSAKPHVEGFFG